MSQSSTTPASASAPTHEDLAALELQMVQLRTALDQAVAAARLRNRISLTAALLVIVLIISYLSFAYYEISRTDAEVAAQFAQVQIMDYLPAAGRQIEGKLTNEAPVHIDALEKKVRELPVLVAGQVRTTTVSKLKEVLPKLEEELSESIRTSLQVAHGQLKEKVGPTGKVKAEQLIDEASKIYGQELQKFVDKVYAQYAQNAGYVTAHLGHLADGKDLDGREQIQRQAVQYFLAMLEVQRREAEAKAAAPKKP